MDLDYEFGYRINDIMPIPQLPADCCKTRDTSKLPSSRNLSENAVGDGQMLHLSSLVGPSAHFPGVCVTGFLCYKPIKCSSNRNFSNFLRSELERNSKRNKIEAGELNWHCCTRSWAILKFR